ncbi:MAG: hypothetical protein LUO79_03900 [Methanomassiliicoccales archaeon]|nr:hypothetical protein [Methanomassiliicoccales archaeon]
MRKGEMKAWRLVGVAAGIAVIVEGAVLSSLEGTNQTTLAIAFIVLGLLAAAPLAATVFMSSRFGRFLRVPALIAAPVGLVVGLIAVDLAWSGDRAVTLGMESQPVYIVAIFIAQLFFVGMALFIASAMSETRMKVWNLLAYGGGAAAAAEGLVVMGIAAPTVIQGIGGVLGSTIQLLGVQLFAVALAFIILSIAAEWIPRGKAIWSLSRSTFAALLVLEGIALTVLATPVDVKGIGGMLESTVMLAGLQLAVLGLFTLAMCGLSANPESPKTKKLAILAAVFLAFLIPMAVLTAGKVL